MKSILMLVFVLLLSQKGQATGTYYNMFVPQALSNLGITNLGWNTNCITCHTTNAGGFGMFNATFGTAFINEVNALGFTITAGNGADLTQAQVQTIISNLMNADSDGDTISNRDEWAAGTNVSVANSTGGGGGGTTGGPCETDPSLPQCQSGGGGGEPGQNSSSSSGSSSTWNDQAYQLNPGCAAQETVQRETKNINKAGSPIMGFALLWLVPILVTIFRRRR